MILKNLILKPLLIHFLIIDLPILKVNENDLINIKNGELMNNDLFKTKETYILEYDGNVVATYVPFNEKYFKPDKVII